MSCDVIVSDCVVVERIVEQAVSVVIEDHITESVVVSVGGTVEIVEMLGETRIIEAVADTQIIEIGGKQGPPGPPGEAGASAIQFTAAVPIGGHRAVRLSAGALVYANNTSLNDANVVLGITTGAASAGQIATVQTGGLMTEPSWAWSPDQPVFVGAAGALTQTSPGSGFSLVVGIATSPTQILIGAKSPIVLQE